MPDACQSLPKKPLDTCQWRAYIGEMSDTQGARHYRDEADEYARNRARAPIANAIYERALATLDRLPVCDPREAQDRIEAHRVRDLIDKILLAAGYSVATGIDILDLEWTREALAAIKRAETIQ